MSFLLRHIARYAAQKLAALVSLGVVYWLARRTKGLGGLCHGNSGKPAKSKQSEFKLQQFGAIQRMLRRAFDGVFAARSDDAAN